jgi:hypothetical protein
VDHHCRVDAKGAEASVPTRTPADRGARRRAQRGNDAEERQPQGQEGLRVRGDGEMRGDGAGRPVRRCCRLPAAAPSLSTTSAYRSAAAPANAWSPDARARVRLGAVRLGHCSSLSAAVAGRPRPTVRSRSLPRCWHALRWQSARLLHSARAPHLLPTHRVAQGPCRTTTARSTSRIRSRV